MTQFVTSQCAILVGGRGSRLGPAFANRPKPLIAIDGEPFLKTLISEVERQHFSRILLLAGYQSDQVVAFVKALQQSGQIRIPIEISIEPEPLGTAGAIAHASALLEDVFFLLNGDSWFDFNWRDLDLLLHASPDAHIALALRWETDSSRFGVATLRGEVVTAFRERGSTQRGLINGGVYCCRRTLVQHLPRSGSLELDVLPELADRSQVVGRIYEGPFIDIGIPASLAEAQRLIPKIKDRPAAVINSKVTAKRRPSALHRNSPR